MSHARLRPRLRPLPPPLPPTNPVKPKRRHPLHPQQMILSPQRQTPTTPSPPTSPAKQRTPLHLPQMSRNPQAHKPTSPSQPALLTMTMSPPRTTAPAPSTHRARQTPQHSSPRVSPQSPLMSRNQSLEPPPMMALMLRNSLVLRP
ncbi:hypothetical protein BDV12DRAFT_177965 [Aspergillus spectabilis]